MKLIKFFLLIAALLVIFGPVQIFAKSIIPDDASALAGIKEGKAVFDVRTKDPKTLLFILKVIEQTEKEMQKQGVKPDFILSFRGGTLPLLTSDPGVKNTADKAILKEVRTRLGKMRGEGMVLEACNVAAGVFEITQEDLADNLTMVGNSLISLIGYQNKGYALVPMY